MNACMTLGSGDRDSNNNMMHRNQTKMKRAAATCASPYISRAFVKAHIKIKANVKLSTFCNPFCNHFICSVWLAVWLTGWQPGRGSISPSKTQMHNGDGHHKC